MGKVSGFKEIDRKDAKYEAPEKRIKHFRDFITPLGEKEVKDQGARCMDCGVPFCHTGCPLGNLIPDWNDLVYRGQWEQAYHMLASTNNFPEFTGKICPAPCENSCVLNINKPAVAIKSIEWAIIDKAFEKGYIKPRPPKKRSGFKVAVVGSGPAGLAAADQLNKAGHAVNVFEKDDRIGGLLMYGIPDFKLEKEIIERRVRLMEAEGIHFEKSAHVGVNVPSSRLKSEYDAIVLACGSNEPRDLELDGREAKGIQYAMDFLKQNNRLVAGLDVPKDELIHAKDKHVIVIGAGDTASDCIGTSNRQGAASVTQIYYKPAPPKSRMEHEPWPVYPNVFRTTSSQEEGVNREWSFQTKNFIADEKGQLSGIRCIKVEWDKPGYKKRINYRELPGTEFTFKADLVLLALGYTHTIHEGLVESLDLDLDGRGNIKTDKQYRTSEEKIFSAGDMRIGQSLVVDAISEGRECAKAVDEYFSEGKSLLKAKESSSFDDRHHVL